MIMKAETRIRTIGIVGSDPIGRGIATSVANAGIRVIMQDISQDAIKRSLDFINKELDHEISRWGITVSEKKSILSLITFTTNLPDLKNVDFVIEAVAENLSQKMNVFAKLDNICSESTIFVANPATLSITEIAFATKRQDRCIGAHFMSPVFKVPIVEVIRGVYTSQATVDKMLRFLAQLGKQPVEVFESPGNITTRTIVPMLNEAMTILMEGVATADSIDKAMKYGFNFSVGPLQLSDILGLDRVMHWMESLFRETGDPKFRPCPILRLKVRAGQLGVKSGQGFFKYDEDGRKIKGS